MHDLDFRDPSFTWHRGEIFERLDIAIGNRAWLNEFPRTIVTHLPTLKSDHKPLLLSIRPELRISKERPFRFLTRWLEHPRCYETVLKRRSSSLQSVFVRDVHFPLTFLFSSMMIPKGLYGEIERIVKQFIWGSSEGHLRDQNISFMMKIGYNLVSKKDDLWVRVIRSKYGMKKALLDRIWRGNCSTLWRVVSKKLLTTTEHVKRGIGYDSSCDICGNHSKDILHVTRDCLVAKEIWMLALPNGIIGCFFVGDLIQWLKGVHERQYAVVTGANKVVGLEICKQLAQDGIMVVLTARDEKRGLEALESLKYSVLSDYLIFHQFDVADLESIVSLTDFVKKQFGKLDFLVNNVGILGIENQKENHLYDYIELITYAEKEDEERKEGRRTFTWTYELAEECLKMNYYGAKRTAEALNPLLQLSDLPRIVTVSSSKGKGEKLKGVLTGVTTDEKLNDLITEYLKDFKEGLHGSKGWPTFISAYTVSKVALNAYTRILANKYPDFCINSVCPGYAKTDINLNTGTITAEEGAVTPVKLALLPKGGPSGLFFVNGEPATPKP
ncbi:(+)-neomenthol dehydrogenase-like [Gossypium arboreum]|uniref:(+)-neomenthol dehydrogenase-like n=1 Tax=Gossypium arboreum TaxID=29729 RepID=UPI0022F19D39|nr:(+)-neomenthol dehydrogenase-like [Gossypium arboreum]